MRQLDYKNGTIYISFEYNASLVAMAQRLPQRQLKNLTAFKGWVVPFKHYEKVLELFDVFPQTPAFKEAVESAEHVANASKMLGKALAERVQNYSVSQLPDGRTLKQHQITGYEHILKHRNVILADDMGLGKTLTSLVAAKAFDVPIIVIAPASLLINWQREADSVEVTIKVYSWAKIPTLADMPDSYVLIADEAHYAQSLKSARTQAFLTLADSKRCISCIAVTGTPIKNGRPINLYPLLLAIKHPLADDKSHFETKYCNAHLRRFGSRRVWDNSGASHLPELHSKLDGYMLRRTKAECLDLPEKTRVKRTVELSKTAKDTYDTKFRALRAQYRENMQAKAEKLVGKEATADAVNALAVGLAEQYDPIVILGNLRQAASVAKVESAVDIAQEVIEQGGSVVLFVAFTESGYAIAEALGAMFLHGGVAGFVRQTMVDEFQNGNRKALVCTFGAGGVGITLTTAQTVILVDRMFTPGENQQSEDRLHRIGQTSAVTAIWLQYGTTDEMIDTLVESKQRNVDIILNGEAVELSQDMSIAQLAEQAVKAAFR